jgi:hypothetical protein
MNLAGCHAVVRWQVSQAAVVTMWPAALPWTTVPLWQAPQLPGLTPAWLKRAPAKVAVLWHASQGCVTGM